MHIGIDATSWQNRRGFGRYMRPLLRALVRLDSDTRYTFFLDSLENTEGLPSGAEVHVVPAQQSTAQALTSSSSRQVRDIWSMSRALSQADLDVLLFATVWDYVPVWNRCPKALILFDIIAETYSPFPSRTNELFWRAKSALARWQADVFFTISEYTRQSIAAYYGMDPASMTVISPASHSCFRVLADPQPTPRLAAMRLTPSYRHVVYVGGFEPHKNLERMLAVYARVTASAAFADTRFVVVGSPSANPRGVYERLQHQAARLGLDGQVVFTGFLPDEDLVVLLNYATVLVQPSLMEGFGLPAVEAAACGCPVIATTASPLPALLGEGGLFVEPTDEEALETALRQVLTSADLRARMSVAGPAAAAQLSWEDGARKMKHVLHAMAETRA